MKKLLPLLILLVVPVIALLTPGPDAALQTSTAVQLSPELKAILSSLILAGVALGLQVVFHWTGLDLRGIGSAIAVTVSAFAVGQLQGYIDVIPAAYDQAVTIFLQVVTVILTGLGALRALIAPGRSIGLLEE